MQFRSFENLNRTIAENLHKVPKDIDLIIGIPRSGLMAATILALHLHLPLTDVNGFLNGTVLSSGERLNSTNANDRRYKHALLIDDSIHTGRSMDKTIEKIESKVSGAKITKAAVFMNPKSVSKADLYFELCPVPRIFEWNMMNHIYLKDACVDIDGVLCPDPTPEENDDGENYLHFVENTPPLLRCKKRIGYLVTNRLEKYRAPTEKWLLKQGIEYDHLIMQNLPDKKTRQELNNYGRFKAKAYIKYDNTKIFFESSYKQAREIAELSGKMVYCVDKRVMIRPTMLAESKRRTRSLKRKLLSKLNQIITI